MSHPPASETLLSPTAESILPPAVPEPATAAKKTPLHLPYLDGIRAVAALYVLHHHILQFLGWNHYNPKANPLWLHFVNPFAYGHYAVVVFIVLSGYCLMLPVARSADFQLKGGLKTYFLRRARRILPPYYAALGFSLLLIVPSLLAGRELGKESFAPGMLISHLLLVHNLNPEWTYGINGPLWSIATEWQIYFFFPLLLVIWRRLGNAAAIISGFAMGLALMAAFPSIKSGCPWFIGMFALGMAAAAINFDIRRATLLRLPWQWLAAALFLAAWIITLVAPQFLWYPPKGVRISPYYFDTLIGFATASSLIYLTRESLATNSKNLVLRAFTIPKLVQLGTFSYSLYLIHVPLVDRMEKFITGRHLGEAPSYLILVCLGIPVVVGLAYLFHRLFERPFMNPAHVKKPVAS